MPYTEAGWPRKHLPFGVGGRRAETDVCIEAIEAYKKSL